MLSNSSSSSPSTHQPTNRPASRSAGLAARALPWIGFVGDLLQQPLTVLPRELIMGQLRQTFACNGAGYTWAEADGTNGNLLDPTSATQALLQAIHPSTAKDLTDRHPLRTWHLATGDPRPSTIDRVPVRLVPVADRRPVTGVFRIVGCEHQLTINVRLGGSLYSTFLVGRSDTDFDDHELALAGQLQQLLVGLDRQVALVGRLSDTGTDQGLDAGLTVRELTVLALLSEGHSTQVIARRLACSPRTVHKHLERIYRKLGVRDRVNAIRVAQHWHLHPPPATSR